MESGFKTQSANASKVDAFMVDEFYRDKANYFISRYTWRQNKQAIRIFESPTVTSLWSSNCRSPIVFEFEVDRYLPTFLRGKHIDRTCILMSRRREPPLPEDQVEEEDEQVQEDGADQEVPLVERECQHEKIAEFVKERKNGGKDIGFYQHCIARHLRHTPDLMPGDSTRVTSKTSSPDVVTDVTVNANRTRRGVIAGRQMSYTSGEFIVKQIQRDMMAQIGDIVEVLPDPSLRKRKAKPEEVQMIRRILEDFLDENMDAIVPEEEVEEEEKPVPQVVVVHAVPGIGPPVDVETVSTFVEYAVEISKVQADCFMPRNIRHFMCPPLESHVEVDYQKPDEELPTDGAMTV
ncbi:hypothetical protein EVAR_78861_1 [Eumeta japonica]|uniref:Uncharacterized protein n=1 Tax=Eumeta variegata TaxID=151549 RepID=A0A4C1U2A2_EUMVA|nr:hypothetical protein EVAR_78861_1 [Eumeta japonica]